MAEQGFKKSNIDKALKLMVSQEKLRKSDDFGYYEVIDLEVTF